LHGRPGVSESVKARILKAASEMGYHPNRAGRILSLRKKPRRIGVLLPSVGNSFFGPLIEGMKKCEGEYSDMGFSLSLSLLRGFSEEEHVEAIRKLSSSGVDALVLATLDSESVRNELSSLPIPFATVNTDVSLEERLYYVGPDYRMKGEINAGLLSLSERKGRILVLRGSASVRGHAEMTDGFLSALSLRGHDASCVKVVDTLDDEERVRRAVRDEGADIIYAATSGGDVAAREAKEGAFIFSSDVTDEIVRMVREGRIMWTVTQEPYEQGYKSIKKMCDFLIDGVKPKSEMTSLIVRIKENIEEGTEWSR